MKNWTTLCLCQGRLTPLAEQGSRIFGVGLRKNVHHVTVLTTSMNVMHAGLQFALGRDNFFCVGWDGGSGSGSRSG